MSGCTLNVINKCTMQGAKDNKCIDSVVLEVCKLWQRSTAKGWQENISFNLETITLLIFIIFKKN